MLLRRFLLTLLLTAPSSLSAQTLPGPFTFERGGPDAKRLSIVAAGDILLHAPLHRQALTHPDGHRSLWSEVEPYFKSAGMAYANLEGPIAPGVALGGRAVKDPGRVFDGRVYSSYPLFNYHAHLADDLMASGVDVISTANNHALDRGKLGADATITELERVGLAYTGTRRSGGQADPRKVPWQAIVEREGFRVAWLACSYSTNGVPDPDHQVLHCFTDRQVVMDLIRRLASHPGVDAVILTPHMGNEYELSPRKQEVDFAREMIDAGALAVLGAHPHVLQPWETHRTPGGRTGLIAYSLGNLVSGQFHRTHTQASVLISLHLARRPDGSVFLEDARYLPMQMVRGQGGYQVRPFPKREGGLWKHVEGQFATPRKPN